MSVLDECPLTWTSCPDGHQAGFKTSPQPPRTPRTLRVLGGGELGAAAAAAQPLRPGGGVLWQRWTRLGGVVQRSMNVAWESFLGWWAGFPVSM